MLWPRVQAQQQQQGAQWRSLWEWGTYNDCAGGGVPMEHSIHTCSTERSLPCMAPQPTTGGASACPRRPNLAEIHDTACTSHPVAPITAAARVNEEMCVGAPGWKFWSRQHVLHVKSSHHHKMWRVREKSLMMRRRSRLSTIVTGQHARARRCAHSGRIFTPTTHSNTHTTRLPSYHNRTFCSTSPY